MKGQTKDSAETGQRLLTAASKVFAEKGYRVATVAEICRLAGANIAAVNYHFGSKESLYVETWRHCFAESTRAHPTDGGVAGDAPAEDRLRGQVQALLTRISDESNMEFLIVQKERANPTGLLHEVMRKQLEPLRQRTESVIRELLGPRASDRDVQFCAISIISQCLDPVVVERGNRARRDRGTREPVPLDLDAYVEHVVSFSLAGVSALREKVERKRPPSGQRRNSSGAGTRSRS